LTAELEHQVRVSEGLRCKWGCLSPTAGAAPVPALGVSRHPVVETRRNGRALTSPRAVRNALVYVLANFRKHANARFAAGVDAFSSAAAFDGWNGVRAGSLLPRAGPSFHVAMARHVVVSEPETWLCAKGWRRRGLVGLDEGPRE